MTLNADMGTRMTERFNVAGALLVKLFGTPAREEAEYAERAGRVRDIGIQIALNRTIFMAALTLVAALATAMVYGFGGVMAVNGTLSVGTLLALAALLARLYGPLTSLSNVRVDIMTALISFERVFEVLDLEPLVKEQPGRRRPARAVRSASSSTTSAFRYPSADEVSLASLESVASGDRRGSGVVLHDITVSAPAGHLVALVGPSGAGKTTLTSLVSRLYDPSEGAVRIGGVDLRDVTMTSLRDRVGVVTQEAHLFHDTIRANLLYARPDATDDEIHAALRAAQISALVDELPEGLDTVVGDRGHRLSGGEKQRLAIARLLLKAPDVVVLDEATAHLDSESEVAVQRALDAALEGRTSIVIAHRLSTIRQADLIVVLDHGRVVETGRHSELLARGGLYADLHATQFDDQSVERAERQGVGADSTAPPRRTRPSRRRRPPSCSDASEPTRPTTAAGGQTHTSRSCTHRMPCAAARGVCRRPAGVWPPEWMGRPSAGELLERPGVAVRVAEVRVLDAAHVLDG